MGNISGEIEGHIEKMASLNYIVPKVIQIANDNNSSARDIIKIIQMDPVLTGKAIKLVNSAFFGLRNEIANLSRAVILLGMSTVRNLALSCSVMSSFKFNDKICKLTSEEFWKYSMGVSAMCQIIARFRKETKKDIDEYFLAGMLHNIGKALLVQSHPTEYNKAIEIADNESKPISLAEEEVFGVSHQMVGERLAQKWKLPQVIIDGMLHYTNPTEAQEKHTLVISISSLLLKQSHTGFSGDYFEHEISDELWHKAKISHPTALNLLQDELPTKMEEAQKFIKGN